MRWDLRAGIVLSFCLTVPTGRTGTTGRKLEAESQAPLPAVRRVSAIESVPERALVGDLTQPLPSPAEYRLAADPFKYRAPEGGDGFVPAPIDMPEGILVVGILMMNSGQSLAALKLPGEDELYYVAEDDDVPIRARPRSAPGASAASRAAAGAESGIFYLKIKRITARHVEVFPEHSPTNIQILR
jgi:hypothetical protein